MSPLCNINILTRISIRTVGCDNEDDSNLVCWRRAASLTMQRMAQLAYFSENRVHTPSHFISIDGEKKCLHQQSAFSVLNAHSLIIEFVPMALSCCSMLFRIFKTIPTKNTHSLLSSHRRRHDFHRILKLVLLFAPLHPTVRRLFYARSTSFKVSVKVLFSLVLDAI